MGLLFLADLMGVLQSWISAKTIVRFEIKFPLAIFHAIGYNFNVACLLGVMDIT